MIAQTARKHTLARAATAEKPREFWPVHEASCAGIDVAISRRVIGRAPRRGSQNSDGRSMARAVEMVMRRLTTFGRCLVGGGLVVCAMSLAAPCAAQENPDLPAVLHPIWAMDVAQSSRLRPGWW